MSDIPDNVDLNWIARTLLALRTDVSDLKHDMRVVREDLGALTMRVIRMDNELHALRDDVRTLFELHGDLRGPSRFLRGSERHLLRRQAEQRVDRKVGRAICTDSFTVPTKIVDEAHCEIAES